MELHHKQTFLRLYIQMLSFKLQFYMWPGPYMSNWTVIKLSADCKTNYPITAEDKPCPGQRRLKVASYNKNAKEKLILVDLIKDQK